jgi:hypothetical protein
VTPDVSSRLGIAAILAAGLSGCAETYVVVEIQAELEVPDEVDQLHLVCFDPDHPDPSLINEAPMLRDGMAFPVDFVLEPSSTTPSGVLIYRVRALKNGALVGEGETPSAWRTKTTNNVTVTIERTN